MTGSCTFSKDNKMKNIFYIVGFLIPSIALIVSDIAIYFKVNNETTTFNPITLSIKAEGSPQARRPDECGHQEREEDGEGRLPSYIRLI